MEPDLVEQNLGVFQATAHKMNEDMTIALSALRKAMELTPEQDPRYPWMLEAFGSATRCSVTTWSLLKYTERLKTKASQAAGSGTASA
jgi:hypothetical protein